MLDTIPLRVIEPTTRIQRLIGTKEEFSHNARNNLGWH
jgi:hypothetical protein